MSESAYTISALAKRWACSRQAIYKLIETGRLRTFSIGLGDTRETGTRISAEEVRRFESGELIETV